MLRIKFRDGVLNPSFGTIKDTDDTVYNAIEVQIHTPGEHRINGKESPMEIQIIHEATSGNYKNSAILSFVFKEDAGASNAAIREWNLIDMPNPDNKTVNSK